MANSIYEYVKSFEVEDEVMLPNLIAVLIQGRNFHRFCNIHDFEKPNDEKALNLMNSCATAVLEKYPDIVYSYGFSDEYSFVFKKDSTLYQRRSRNMTQSRLTIIHYPSLRAKLAWRCLSPISYFGKILSLVVSFFTSMYVRNWKYYFPHTELRFPPSFKSRVIVCASPEVLQHYLKWRQDKCHAKNLCSTCLWMLIIKHEKTEREAQKVLEETQTIEGKHELLFKEFDINYNNLPIMFRQGSCALKTELEDIVKYTDDGTPIKRLRRKVIVVHAKNIASRSFWNGHPCLVKELGRFKEDINKVKPEFEKSFKFEHTLMPSTWIVVRIDGCHFHRFSEVHEFERPNDGQALKLMNSCAVATLEEFQENQDIVFSYGVSDEYSFVLKKDSQLYQRRASCIVSVIVSFFSSMYVMKWKEFFPQKELKYPPYFDGRAVCYPSTEILQDYLAWRQVDCHINNQYNTCFWMLVKSGKSKREAQKVTQSEKKNDLFKEFDLHYETLPAMFRRGSSVFWDKEVETVMHDDDDVPRGKFQKKVVIEHCDIIKPNFWKEHPSILDEKQAMLSV